MQHSTSTCCCGWSLELVLQTTCTRVEPRQDLRSLRHPRCVHASARALRSSAALFPSAAAEWAKPSRSAAALRRLACETPLSIFAFCEAPGAREFSHRTSELRTLKHCVLSCFIAISVKMCTGHPPNCPPRFASTAAEHPQYARNQRHSIICFSGACTFSRCARESYHRVISSICARESTHSSIFYSISKCCCGVCLELILHHIRTGVDPQQDLLSEEHNAVAARLRDTFEGYQKRTA